MVNTPSAAPAAPRIPRPVGHFSLNKGAHPLTEPAQWEELFHASRQEPLFLTQTANRWALCPLSQVAGAIQNQPFQDSFPLYAVVPIIIADQLGSQKFKSLHRVRFAYVGGSMANGIASEGMVIALARAGFLGFFGAGGLNLDRVARAIDEIQAQVGDLPYGFNLLHNPFEPLVEQGTVDLYLKREVRLIEASAFLGLSLPVVQYRLHGLKRGPDGRPLPWNHIIAKVSRGEVAKAFMSPPPEAMVRELLRMNRITAEEAALAPEIPMAEDITGEADSGGHTDRRPFVTLLPTFLTLRDQIQSQFRFAREIRVGGGGGIATPGAVAGAFSMGAAYVVTGSVNQICVESGTSDPVRMMLQNAQPHDCIMAPAADMFEMGVKLQVLKYGTMFPMRAEKLYSLYQQYGAVEEIPEKERETIEKQIFQKKMSEIWDETVAFFNQRDPSQLEKAATNPKHKLALICRWYLGKSSRWAITGDPARKMDYQVWCGPAMGSFNEWVKGTFLEKLENLTVAQVGYNLMEGGAVLSRLNYLRCLGIDLPLEVQKIKPRAISSL